MKVNSKDECRGQLIKYKKLCPQIESVKTTMTTKSSMKVINNIKEPVLKHSRKFYHTVCSVKGLNKLNEVEYQTKAKIKQINNEVKSLPYIKKKDNDKKETRLSKIRKIINCYYYNLI